jgi:hypothetical protein
LHYPDFIAALVRGRKRRQEIKPLVDRVYGDKTLSHSQINRIIRAVKDGKKTSPISHFQMTRKREGPPTLGLLLPPLLRRIGSQLFF